METCEGGEPVENERRDLFCILIKTEFSKFLSVVFRQTDKEEVNWEASVCFITGVIMKTSYLLPSADHQS